MVLSMMVVLRWRWDCREKVREESAVRERVCDGGTQNHGSP
jgi:hypothetical protein